MKQLRYIDKTLKQMKQTKNHGQCLLRNKAKCNETEKQDETDQKPWSMLVTKQGEMQ